MGYHIVKINETLKQISLNYGLEETEIMQLNKYIRDWNHLIAGTKLKLPEISEGLNLHLDSDEPFIEEYYPQLDYEKYEEILKKENQVITNVDNNINEDINENTKSINNTNIINKKQYINYPYMPYQYYYPYRFCGYKRTPYVSKKR